ARASGELPFGTPGKLAHEAVLRECEPIALRVRELETGEPLPSRSVAIELPGGVELTGELSKLRSTGQLRAQYSRVSGKQILATWIRHLVLAATSGEREVPR